jgi:hypothetical protein
MSTVAICGIGAPMKTYRIVEYPDVPGGAIWALVRQESDDVTHITPISAHSSAADAQKAKAARESKDSALS